MHVCVHVYVWMHVQCARMCMEARGRHQVPSLIVLFIFYIVYISLYYFLRQCHSLSPEHTNWLERLGRKPWGFHLCH